MRLAIIIPTWQEAEGIRACLQSLQMLRRAGHCVVVDGGSTDGTADRARMLADEVLTAPRGRARQMNAAVQSTVAQQADVWLFLHADTGLPPSAGEAIQSAIHRGYRWGRFDVRIEGQSPWLAMIALMMNGRSRLSGIATGDQGLFIRRETFIELRGFADQPLMEDIEICRRLKRLGPPACLRDRVSTSGRRWEKHGVWRTIFLMWHLRWLYWRGVPADKLALRYRPHQSG